MSLPDTSAIAGDASAPFDTVWTTANDLVAQSGGLEDVMLAHDKLYVVLGVVLIIWFGLIFFMLRTDKKLRALERSVDEGIAPRAPRPSDRA